MATPIKPYEVWDPEDAATEQRLRDLYAGQQNAAQAEHPMGDAYATYREHPAPIASFTELPEMRVKNLGPPYRIPITDHAEASAVMLEGYAARIRGGTSPEDLGKDVELLGRIMARRT